MAFRPNWYGSAGNLPSGRGWRSWTGVGTILRLTFLCYLLEHLILAAGGGPAVQAVWYWLGLRAWTPDGWVNPLFVLQLATYPLLHSLSGLGHVGMNMFFLWMFGRELEANMGKRAFLRLYVGAAVGSGLVQWAWTLTSGWAWGHADAAPTIGASGAVYAVMVLYACRYPRRVIMLLFPPIPLPVYVLVGARVLMDLLAFLGSLRGAPSNVAVACHLGGAAMGFLWFRRGDVLERMRQQHRRSHAMAEFRQEAEERLEMDRILSKIQATGLASLTRAERGYLDRRSRDLRNGTG